MGAGGRWHRATRVTADDDRSGVPAHSPCRLCACQGTPCLRVTLAHIAQLRASSLSWKQGSFACGRCTAPIYDPCCRMNTLSSPPQPMSGRCSPASSTGTGRPWCARGRALRRVAAPARGALLQPHPARPRAAGAERWRLQTVIAGENPAGLHGSVCHLPGVMTLELLLPGTKGSSPEQLTALLLAARSLNHQCPESSSHPPARWPAGGADNARNRCGRGWLTQLRTRT